MELDGTSSSIVFPFIQYKTKLKAMDQFKSIQLYIERSGPTIAILARNKSPFTYDKLSYVIMH